MFKLVLLCIVMVLSDAAHEGELCTKDGKVGKCTILQSCRTAIDDIKNRKHPQICSFDLANPIVCCIDDVVASLPTPHATTPESPASQPASDPKPEHEIGDSKLPECIEYQEKYVFPCDRGVDLLGGLSRRIYCHHSAEELIVRGTEAFQHQFPHMVLIGFGPIDNIQWLCGGAIISEQYILTAAHCTLARDLGPASYVLVGAHRKSDAVDRSKVYKIKQFIRHPEYNPPRKYNDIALLETEKTINLDQFVVPACLHLGEDINDDTVIATGWGLREPDSTDNLQKTYLKKFTAEQCNDTYTPWRLLPKYFDPRTQLCYADKTSKNNTCMGDSGGPIQIKNKNVHCMYTIIGVSSFGKPCRFVEEPAVYTRVSAYVSWIENIVWPN
ncbi:serine protease snake-like [Trichoplusia ni]|uniref:Serine protease snake-like n=1 Tax=Trichoplusia ni TaxID=7111 RepID=A0A7E5WVY6_TRINI|nr:serine protease snake-like [Trichoplusia ni]